MPNSIRNKVNLKKEE